MKLDVILLAAGKSSRMGSSYPKVLYPIAGVPILQRIIDTVKKMASAHIYLVHHAQQRELFENTLTTDSQLTWVIQKEALGTADAVKQVLPLLDKQNKVLVLCGDVPLIRLKSLEQMLRIDATLVLLTAIVSNPESLGRIVRDQAEKVLKIVEQRDASAQYRTIKEIFSGILLTDAATLQQWLPKITSDNAQKEYYLTDLVNLIVARDKKQIIKTVVVSCAQEVSGINNLVDLTALERYCQLEQAHKLLKKGVWIVDPQRFDLRGTLTVGSGVKIGVNVIIEGEVRLGNNVTIASNVVLRDLTVSDDVHIKENCVLEDATIGEGSTIGPFVHIRPGVKIRQNVKIGNFVELKNTHINDDSKIPHLSYIGDAHIGSSVNIGAGCITCNFDGKQKHTTHIEDGSFVGSNVTLIAPLSVGEASTIGAGSVISKNTPAFHLSVSRTKQRSIRHWHQLHAKKDSDVAGTDAS